MDILSLHQNILSRLLAEENSRNIILVLFENISEKYSITDKNEIEKFKKVFSNDNTADMFKAQTMFIIEEYAKILKNPISHKRNLILHILKKKHELVNAYLSISQTFAKNRNWTDLYIPACNDFKAVENSKTEDVCINCGNFDVDNFDYDEYNRRICLECFSQFSDIETGLTPNDYSRINTMSKFNYNRILHFQDCIRQYQGKQNCRVAEKIYKDLEQKFKAYRILIDNTNPQIRYSKVTRNHIVVFLKELKHIKHYENVNLIYFTLTNKRFDDITYLEEHLMDDFKKLIVLYDSLHGKDMPAQLNRKNFMNIQYLLFQLLKRHGHKCKIENFTIIKTIDRKLFHDNICKNLFNILNWKFTPIF